MQRIPFTVTWRESELYIAAAAENFRIFKVLLPVHESTASEEVGVLTPAIPVILPQSAQGRTVRLFPYWNESDTHFLLLGSRRSESVAPPIGVYLREKKLGGWVEVNPQAMHEDGGNLSMRCHDFFEPFDAEDDCDLIPFDPNF